jgi:hypothetical protein
MRFKSVIDERSETAPVLAHPLDLLKQARLFRHNLGLSFGLGRVTLFIHTALPCFVGPGMVERVRKRRV